MEKEVLKKRSFSFAVRIVKLSRSLVETRKEYVISKQLLRSGTAIGALVREAEHAESSKDFIHKFSIALKEANECEYWLNLLFETQLMEERLYSSFLRDCQELLRLLISSLNTLKANLKNKKF